MFGLEKAGKTHMLYSYLVGKDNMEIVDNDETRVRESKGMNCEKVSL